MVNASLYCRNGSKSKSIVHLPLAKFEHWLRKAAQRTAEAVYDAIAPILKTVSPTECANYFANAGYNQT